MHTLNRPPARRTPGGVSSRRRVRKDSPSSAPPPKHYTSSAELSDLIRCYRQMRRRMAAAKLLRLEELVAKIAGGIWSKYQHINDREEFVQECWVRFISKVFKRVDPSKNAFSYITTAFINLGNNLRVKAVREGQGEDGYRKEYIRDERYQTFDPDPE